MGDVDKYKLIIEKKENLKELSNDILTLYTKEMQMYRLVDRVVCLSQDTYNLLQMEYSISSSKIFLIPNGFRQNKYYMQNYNREKLRKELFIPDDEKIVLFVGRPTIQKGIYALLNAFHIVLKSYSKARLVIIGSDNGNKIENLINISSNFATHVSFLGLINKKELDKWYCIADIGVIPSYYEQCPYVGLEMMIHELPIIASDGFGIRNMFQDKINALIAPIGKRESSEEFSYNLAKAINKLFLSEELRHNLGKNAKQKFDDFYSVDRMKKGYEALLSSL